MNNETIKKISIAIFVILIIAIIALVVWVVVDYSKDKPHSKTENILIKYYSNKKDGFDQAINEPAVSKYEPTPKAMDLAIEFTPLADSIWSDIEKIIPAQFRQNCTPATKLETADCYLGYLKSKGEKIPDDDVVSLFLLSHGLVLEALKNDEKLKGELKGKDKLTDYFVYDPVKKEIEIKDERVSIDGKAGIYSLNDFANLILKKRDTSPVTLSLSCFMCDKYYKELN